MQNDNGNNNPPEGPRSGGPGGAGDGGNFNWKGLILISIAVGIFALAIMHRSGSAGNSEDVPYAEFKKLVQNDLIVSGVEDKKKGLKIVEGQGKSFITGYFTVDKPIENDGKTEQAFRTQINVPFFKEEIMALLAANDLELQEANTDDNSLTMILVTWVPLILIMLFIFLILRHQFKMAGRGAMNFGKSKAKLMAMDKNKITFKNVAGVDEAKEEVWEIVEFLRDPKKFQRLGGQIPKGVLMVGSPGTGKTLLARAIAGEADVPFFSISGSDFVEMFVGVGASRVRDMFEQGKKNAPCLIFIDEIDAVGRHRGHGLGGGHDEREQTLNQLLVEMDGFDTQEGVIIIAATNRPDVLDPALLRPGRFDRQVTVSLPDVKGREEILRVHIKKVKVADGVDLAVIARGTPGFSGAELANLINEAALLAARKGMKAITGPELEEARDKVRWGKERRSMAISEKEKENTAYHEAGHALLGMLMEHTDPVHKVTIIPRGPSLGSTMYLPKEDHLSYRKNYLKELLITIMGGRVAEELVFKDVTIGASGDIKQASNIARKMVCEWGMSEELGMIEYGDGEDQVFLARDISSPRNYSEATAQKIDTEVKALIDNAYDRATELISEHREQLDLIAAALLEYETIDGEHCQDIMDHGEMRNPPASPTPPSLPGDKDDTKGDDKGAALDGDLPGDLAPAGA